MTKGIFGTVVVVLVVAAVVYLQVAVWNECRTGHSFFYCLSLVAR